MIIYPNKQIRLQKYDYSQPGYYFVTICTKNRTEYFGKVENKTMSLNEVGKIGEATWKQIPNSYKFVALDTFIFMPNHMHGIIIIEPHEDGTPRRAATGLHALEVNSLPSIVNHFKGAMKKECNKNGFTNFRVNGKFGLLES